EPVQGIPGIFQLLQIKALIVQILWGEVEKTLEHERVQLEDDHLEGPLHMEFNGMYGLPIDKKLRHGLVLGSYKETVAGFVVYKAWIAVRIKGKQGFSCVFPLLEYQYILYEQGKGFVGVDCSKVQGFRHWGPISLGEWSKRILVKLPIQGNPRKMRAWN